MTVTSRVRHLIEITTNQVGQPPIVFDFESRDIGFTQGTTIRHGDIIVARYRPGTRYLDTAFEVAEQMLVAAVTRAVGGGGTLNVSRLVTELAAVMVEERCTPWDGNDPNYDEEPW